jgi:hypothetical protein
MCHVFDGEQPFRRQVRQADHDNDFTFQPQLTSTLIGKAARSFVLQDSTNLID